MGATAWDRQRDALRREIIETARQLFLERGFDGTTVDDIAAAVGISRRSFFRYFGTKEDVVLGDLKARGDAVARRLAARPATEGPWAALRGAMLEARPEILGDPAAEMALVHMMRESPTLRARRFEKQSHWLQQLLPLIAQRVAGPNPERTARAIAASALSCVDIAREAWGASGGADIVDLYDEAVAALRASLER